jgi:RNase P subunit RPR2
MRKIDFDSLPEIVSICDSCVHKVGICLLGLTSNNCGSFSEEVLYQMSGKEIGILRNIILEHVQMGHCKICTREIEEGEAVLDHHHKKKVKGTGQIRGVLCRTCNVLLAKSENNSVRYRISQVELPSVLRRMADYLESQQYPYIHPSEKEPPKYLKKSSYNELTKAYRAGKLKKQPPVYPENGKMKLTVVLKRMFEQLNIEPEFYK